MINNAEFSDLQFEDVEDYNADYPPPDYPTSEGNIAAGVVPEADALKKRRGSTFVHLICSNKWTSGLVLVMMIVLIAIISVATGSSKKSLAFTDYADNLTHQKPIEVDPNTLNPTVTGPLMTQLLSAYERKGMDPSALGASAGETPQRKAFYWMASDAESNNDLDHTQTLQRYALATLYYATNAVETPTTDDPIPWTSAHLWLSEAHACEWKGIVCNSQMHIDSIDLARNNLSGSIPMELILINSNLRELDLTSNLIYMRDVMFDVFVGLTELESLLLDDNYMGYDMGLPPQLANLVNLKKLRLSYNLFSGELEAQHKVLAKMGKLTHLEIESNFLSGTIPPVIGDMTNLVYIYLRRNDLSFNLDFLKGGKLTDLFALWLDSNDVTGTIPTDIGLLTELASVSITNASLSGPIPTQMGNLLGLRRLWLYNNQITGTIPPSLDKLTDLEVMELHGNKIGGAMPQGVCYNVGESDYEFKSLTTDCVEEVQCDNKCCTDCF